MRSWPLFTSPLSKSATPRLAGLNLSACSPWAALLLLALPLPAGQAARTAGRLRGSEPVRDGRPRTGAVRSGCLLKELWPLHSTLGRGKGGQGENALPLSRSQNQLLKFHQSLNLPQNQATKLHQSRAALKQLCPTPPKKCYISSSLPPLLTLLDVVTATRAGSRCNDFAGRESNCKQLKGGAEL